MAAAAFALALFLMAAGGISPFHWFGIRISISSAVRPFAVGLAILAIRHYFAPHHPVITRIVARFHPRGDAGEQQLFRTGPSPLHTAAEFLAVAAGFCMLIAVVTWPQLQRLDAVPDLGDPLFSTWRMAWVAHQLPIDPLHLADGNTFYPEKLTLTYSDPMLVPSLMAAPLLWMGVHQVTAYNLLFLSGFALSGVTMFYLARALTGRRDAAVIAGVMFAVYPYRFEHYSHLELQMTIWMPLALLSLHRTMARGRLRDGLLTGLWLALQALSSLYYGVFLATFMVPLGATLWAFRGRPTRPLKMLAAGAVVAAVLTAPVAAAYIANKSVLGERSREAVQQYSALLGDFFSPHFRSARYGQLHIGGKPERQLFPGVMPLALTAVALWPPLSTARFGYALALGLAVDGSLGLNGIVYPWLHQYGVVYRGLRVPARFSVLVGLSFAILAAYATARMIQRWPRARTALTAGVLALLLLDAWPRLEFTSVWAAPPGIYAAIPAGERPVVLAEFPAGPQHDFPYLYFSTFHWQRLLNGNSGFFPRSYDEFITETQDFPDPNAMRYLRTRGVQYIVVHGAWFQPPNDFGRVNNLLTRSRFVEPIMSTPFGGSTTTLYRLKD